METTIYDDPGHILLPGRYVLDTEPGHCAECGGSAADGNGSPLYDDPANGGPLCADCGEARYAREQAKAGEDGARA